MLVAGSRPSACASPTYAEVLITILFGDAFLPDVAGQNRSTFDMRSSSRPLVVAMTSVALVACGSNVGYPTHYQPAPSSCPVSTAASFGGGSTSVSPNYGFGSGPVYLSGQSDWDSGGQTAIILVDSRYQGPISVRASQFGGDGASTITLADLNLDETAAAGLASKEQSHGVQVVSATHRAAGGLTLAAGGPPSSWRAWFGTLSTSGHGCFAIQADGDNFSEVIIVWVQAGAAPPG